MLMLNLLKSISRALPNKNERTAMAGTNFFNNFAVDFAF